MFRYLSIDTHINHVYWQKSYTNKLQNLVKLFTVAVTCLLQMLEVKPALMKRLCVFNVLAAEQIFIARFERGL